jgi:hypothetical protein
MAGPADRGAGYWRLAAWQDSGLRVIAPGDEEWPSQLHDLGDTGPLLLWARGNAALPFPEWAEAFSPFWPGDIPV